MDDLLTRHDLGPVTRLTLSRPATYNALSLEMIEALIAALARIDDETRVVILAAEGKAFCAGHDLRQMQGMDLLRPDPAAGRTADKAARLGFDVLRHPLFSPLPLDWVSPPAEGFDALLLTSANTVRLAGARLAAYRALPTYAVGAATAAALQEAGFVDATSGEGDASAIAARIAADGHRAVLHLAGTTVAAMPLTASWT